jgi:PAS domain S-box-containing protein
MSNPSVTTNINSEPTPRGARVVDYVSAVNACPSGIVITDSTEPDNPIIFVNPAFTELTGYSSAESIGRNCRFLQGPDTDREVISEIEAAIAQGHPIRKEILNYRKDGSEFWNDLAIDCVTDASGRITSMVGVQTDITARKEAQAKSVEAEAQIVRIVGNMPGYVFRRVVKPDGSMQYQNSLFDFGGWSSEFAPFSRENQGQVVHPDDREMLRHSIARSAIDLSPLTTEFRTFRPNGDLRWFRTSSTPRHEANGDIVWDGVGIDVTAEKASQGRLSGLVENMPGYLYQRVRKPDGTIEYPYISPSYGRLVGQATDVPASGADLWANVHPDDRETIRQNIEQSAKTLSQLALVYRQAPRMRQKDGCALTRRLTSRKMAMSFGTASRSI